MIHGHIKYCQTINGLTLLRASKIPAENLGRLVVYKEKYSLHRFSMFSWTMLSQSNRCLCGTDSSEDLKVTEETSALYHHLKHDVPSGLLQIYFQTHDSARGFPYLGSFMYNPRYVYLHTTSSYEEQCRSSNICDMWPWPSSNMYMCMWPHIPLRRLLNVWLTSYKDICTSELARWAPKVNLNLGNIRCKSTGMVR